MAQDNNEHAEKMILAHEAVEGYRPVFLVAITVGILYLGYIFYQTL
jgi:hypothetical protein